MSRIIGIDLGTTNSCVAVMEGGKPVVVANAEGGRTTPSVVAFKDGERLVGQVARRQAVMNPTQTIHSVKRFIGRTYEDAAEDAARVPYELTSDESGAVRLRVDGKDLAPEEVSARVLRKLVDDASKYLGERVEKAVITVPAYFDDSQRNATRDAGRIAGIEVVRVVNEPTAAALAYGLDSKDQETVLVFDLGGGTFDVSILEVGDGVCEVRATSGDTHLGGDDFDAALVDWMVAEFKRDQGLDLSQDRQALQRLSEAAERAKCELSSATSTRVNLPFVTADSSGPKHLDLELTRAKFDQLTEPLVERCRRPVLQALSDAGVGPEEVDHVLLVGGSTRIPAVQALVKELAGGREPNQSVNPDEVVALGAAVQAGILAGEVEDVLLLDVTPLSLGVETMGGLMHRLIERNTTVPCSRQEVFSTAEDDQPAVDVVVLQGEREMARDNKRLAHFRLEGIRPAPRGTPQIEVSFELDSDGILSVSARDKDTGTEQRVQVTDSTRLEQDELDRMVAEAQRNAAEDRRLRERAEQRNRVDQLCYELERGGDAAVSGLVQEARRGLEQGVDGSELDELVHRLEQAVQAQASAATRAEPNPEGGATVGATQDDDVIDADFTVK